MATSDALTSRLTISIYYASWRLDRFSPNLNTSQIELLLMFWKIAMCLFFSEMNQIVKTATYHLKRDNKSFNTIINFIKNLVACL